MTGKGGKAHHAGTYARRAAACVAMAWADPDARCWRPECGLTHAQYAAIHGQQAARWQAGHRVDGQIDGFLAPEHARCNASAGAKHGNAQRNAGAPSRTW